MTVYVDNMQASYGRMKMCHMVADSTDELLAMADRIGVARKWLQKAGTAHEHFDIALSKRALAIEAGAIEVSMMEIGRIIRARRCEPKRCQTNLVGAAGECLACDADQGEAPVANKLTEAQRRLYDDICNHGGSLVVDGRRGTAAKALRAAGLITAVMRLEADMLRGRLTEQWWCRVTGRAALNQDGGA